MSLDAEAMKAFFTETPVECPNCHNTAYVSGVDRSHGKWTCYGCGLVNRSFEAPKADKVTGT